MTQAEMIDELKKNLREESSPFFSDEELLHILKNCRFDVCSATYDCLLKKAEDDSVTLPSGLTVPNNKGYWLRLARRYRHNKAGIIKRSDEYCR